jgi:hypothetical protein
MGLWLVLVRAVVLLCAFYLGMHAFIRFVARQPEMEGTLHWSLPVMYRLVDAGVILIGLADAVILVRFRLGLSPLPFVD